MCIFNWFDKEISILLNGELVTLTKNNCTWKVLGAFLHFCRNANWGLELSGDFFWEQVFIFELDTLQIFYIIYPGGHPEMMTENSNLNTLIIIYKENVLVAENWLDSFE